MGKISKKDLGFDTKGMTEDNAKLLDGFAETIVNAVNKAQEGAITEQQLAEAISKAVESVKSATDARVGELADGYEKMSEVLKNLNDSIATLKQKGVETGKGSKFDEAFNAMYESEKFKSFMAGHITTAKGFDFKGTISLTDNYDGNALIGVDSGIVASQHGNKKAHIRDIISIYPNEQGTNVYYSQVTNVDLEARFSGENAQLAASSFDVKEVMTEVKRVGTWFPISKNMLKVREFVRAYLINKLAEGIRNAEDFGILFGDGEGNNIKGITAHEGVKSVESLITSTIVTGAAGDVKAVTKAKNGVIVELAKANDAIHEGLKITFAGATVNTGINGTFDVIKVTDTQFLLEGAAYTGEETSVAAMTFTVKSGATQSIDTPNSIDALETAVAVMSFADVTPNALLLNPITLNSIRAEKATDGNRLKVNEDINGNSIIGGLRVIPTNAMPVGKYLVGDFVNGAALVEFAPMTIDWAEDVKTKLKNEVAVICDEQVALMITNPWAFAYGSISALKTAIAKPSA